jgi:FAD binding domain
MGPGRHFVHYFVSAGSLVNFVAVTEEDSWLRESWVDRGEVSDVLAAFRGWHNQVLSIIGSADETYKWALFDRSPLPHWSVGRVTLLGDSCHPMLPFMGQGAAQAIEDAATLKGCLLKFPGDVPAALRLYEQLRLPRASHLQGMSETNKTRFHLPDGRAQKERDARMASGATDWSFAAIAWLYEHDAEVVDVHCPRSQLDVEPQQVVLGQTEAADGRIGFQATMWPMPIVAMEPVDQFSRSLSGVAKAVVSVAQDDGSFTAVSGPRETHREVAEGPWH